MAGNWFIIVMVLKMDKPISLPVYSRYTTPVNKEIKKKFIQHWVRYSNRISIRLLLKLSVYCVC